MIFCCTLAISMPQAACMPAIERASPIFGVFSGAFPFEEEKIAERPAGAVVMGGGVPVIG